MGSHIDSSRRAIDMGAYVARRVYTKHFLTRPTSWAWFSSRIFYRSFQIYKIGSFNSVLAVMVQIFVTHGMTVLCFCVIASASVYAWFFTYSNELILDAKEGSIIYQSNFAHLTVFAKSSSYFSAAGFYCWAKRSGKPCLYIKNINRINHVWVRTTPKC